MEQRDAVAANEQWRRHTEDETVARAVQQESAGGTHRPVDGPPPYGDERVNLLAIEIATRERERCARLVETWPAAPREDAVELLRKVAQAIRQS